MANNCFWTMKSIKFMAIMALILLAVPLVSATEMYYFEDFDLSPNQGIILEEGDLVQFEMFGGEHRLRIKEVANSLDKIKLRIFPFIPSKAQAVPLFTIDRVVYVDLNKDGIDDLALDIEKITKDKRVTLIAVALEQPPTEAPETQGMVVKDTGSNYKRTFFFVGMIVIGLIGILAYRKSKSNNEQSEEKSEK